MILRKPYAFLIKNFRLLHFILVCLMSFLLYRTYSLMAFIDNYNSNIKLITGENYVETVFNSGMFIFTIAIIIVSIILFAVMYYKKKPIAYYIYTIGLHIALLILYLLARALIDQMSTMVIDTRTIRVLRDAAFIVLAFQILNLFQTIIRAIGFDLQKFDFKKDLKELEIEQEDNEEFEVGLEFDDSKFKRNINKIIRYTKYFYKEHKLIVNAILVVLICIISYKTYLRISINIKTYSQNTYFNSTDYRIKVKDVYETQYDNFGNQITDDNHTLVIIKLDITNKTGDKRTTFNTGLTELTIGNKKFRHTKNYQKDLNDIGTVYNLETLGLDEVEKLLVYEIPVSLKNKKMYFKFINDINQDSKYKARYVRVKLTPEDLDNDIKATEFAIGDTLSFDDSIVYNSTINIKNIEASKKIKINYDYCISEKECINSIEYIYPKLNTNYDKALVKINGTIEIDEQVNVKNINTLYNFLTKYGMIVYTKNNIEYISKIESQIIPSRVSVKNTIFIETNDDILNADKIKLRIKVRNNIYDYNIK